MEKIKFVEKLINVTNRSKWQTLFLLELLNDDLFKLLELEEKIKNNFIGYCPSDKEECNKILSMSNGSNWYNLTFKQEYEK